LRQWWHVLESAPVAVAHSRVEGFIVDVDLDHLACIAVHGGHGWKFRSSSSMLSLVQCNLDDPVAYDLCTLDGMQ
jgi:hypothetical protein